MSLTITLTADRHLLSEPVIGALRQGLAHAGHVVLLVPTFAAALDVQRELASLEGLGLGVTVTTPGAWIDERWEVWGDGRHMVSDIERLILMRLALRSCPTILSPTSGTLDELASLARGFLAWLPSQGRDATDSRLDTLTAGERAACATLDAYRELLAERDLVERCEAATLLAELLPAYPAVVAAGFSSLAREVRRLLLEASSKAPVQVVAAFDVGGVSALADVLSSEAREAGLSAEFSTSFVAHPVEGQDAPAEELAELHAALMEGLGASEVTPQGAVRLAEPAGPLAEWELVAQEVELLRNAGSREVVVAVPDVTAGWRGLAPRLAARGMHVTSPVRRAASEDVTVTAFLGFAQVVARLATLAQDWPQPVSGPAGTVAQLGDMTWWPPRQLTDFLLSRVSQVEPAQAWELDAKWRGNRSLAPQMVLDQLQRESLTSKVVAQATASVLRGRVGTAALQLARALMEADPDGSREAVSALTSIQDAARTVGAMGVSAASKKGVRVVLPLEELVSLVSDLAQRSVLCSRMELGAGDCHVRILSRGAASALPPRSADALVICGLTSAEWGLSPKDNAAVALLERLGLDESEPPLAVARRHFLGMLEVPTSTLVLERVTHNCDAQATYPAVMLSEALACYGSEMSGMPVSVLGEGQADRLLVADAEPDVTTRVLPVAPAGQVGPAAADMIIVPREGQSTLPDGLPSLSASQIESYLECPYKWFTLRRLGLDATDATFSAVQMGSFAHRVLEVARRRHMQQAAEVAGLVKPGQLMDLEGTDITFVPGSAVTAENLSLVQSLIETEFDFHLAHQYQKATSVAAQSLVPHTATEEYRLDLLRRDLLDVPAFEIGKFRGFEPRYFELRFGGSGAHAHHVSYAGVDFVGTIDRVDVDAHGRAVVIDYKHKGALGFAAEYDAFTDGSPATADALVLPRRVQSLIYAQVVRRMFPQLKVVGAVYLSTKGGARNQHEIAGVLDANAADMVMGRGLTDKRWERLVAGGMGKLSFEELLDETERRIAEKIALLVQGHIEAEPVDKHACEWCPVANCERRLV